MSPLVWPMAAGIRPGRSPISPTTAVTPTARTIDETELLFNFMRSPNGVTKSASSVPFLWDRTFRLGYLADRVRVKPVAGVHGSRTHLRPRNGRTTVLKTAPLTGEAALPQIRSRADPPTCK